MNLVIISYELPPRIGGAGIVALDLAKAFSENGYRVTIVSSYEACAKKFINNDVVIEYIENVRVVRLPVLSKIWFLTFPMLLRKNKNFVKVDSKIVLNDFGAAYSFHKSGSFPERGYTMYVHGKESFLVNDHWIKNGFLGFRKTYLELLNKARSIVCVSNFIQGSLFSYFPQFMGDERFSVVYNSVDEKIFFNVDKDSIPNDLLLNTRSKYRIVTACRLVKGKGFDRKLRIFKELTKSMGLDISWLIIGDGEYRSEFERTIKREGLNNIIFLGRIEREHLKFYYSQCDIFWLLSNYEEAYPLVYHEAQSCGLPVLGYDLGGVGEVIQPEFGRVVNCDRDAIQYISNIINGDVTCDKWTNTDNSLTAIFNKVKNLI